MQKVGNNVQIVNLVQGSPEWHAHRRNHFNASDAPAMLGVSKYTTRDQLLHQYATGLTKEVDAGTQKLFDDGHRFEALARPLAEKIIGDELSPMVATEGKLSASFDGITFEGDTIFEHKTLSKIIVEWHQRGGFGSDLPIMYRAQMEQQLMISGAKKCLFMATIWDGDKLLDEVNCWYEPDLDLRTAIAQGWAQFAIDLENYVPPVQVEKVFVADIQPLPTISVAISAKVLDTNVQAVFEAHQQFISNIKPASELESDEDFAYGEKLVKFSSDFEGYCQAAEDNALSQATSVNDFIQTVRTMRESTRQIRLDYKKALDVKKEAVKTNAILQAKQDYIDHIAILEKGLPFCLQMSMQSMGMYPNFAEAIKGVKTIASMQSRLNDAVAAGKAQATTLANDVKSKLAYIEEAGKGYEHLIVKHDLAFKDIEFIKLSIQSTIDKENARRAEFEAQIKAKAEAEARAKVEAEQRAKELAEAQAAKAQPINEAKPQVTENVQSHRYPTSDLYPLWKHMHDEHGLTLLDSELIEIMRVAIQVNDRMHKNADLFAYLLGLVSEIDVTTSPSLDPRAADVRLESIKQHCAAAHTLIERMAGAHKNALYAEEATS